jgi:hypothetical protein
MSTGAIVAIIVVVVVVAVLIAAAPLMRRYQLRRRFGPEYDRVVAASASRREAEAELVEREKHVKNLDIRPLDPAAARRYEDQWTAIQEQFVDVPIRTVKDAQSLVTSLVKELGYPAEDSSQIMADLSVNHAKALQQYRTAEELSGRTANGMATTEDLRLALVGYRAMATDLAGAPAQNGGRRQAIAARGEPGTTNTGTVQTGVTQTDVTQTGVTQTGTDPAVAYPADASGSDVDPVTAASPAGAVNSSEEK